MPLVATAFALSTLQTKAQSCEMGVMLKGNSAGILRVCEGTRAISFTTVVPLPYMLGNLVSFDALKRL